MDTSDSVVAVSEADLPEDNLPEAAFLLEQTSSTPDPSFAPSLVSSPTFSITPISNWLYRSPPASVLWLGIHLWLGYEWVNAGYQKLRGTERPGFWYGAGTGVKGSAPAGVAGNSSARPPVGRHRPTLLPNHLLSGGSLPI